MNNLISVNINKLILLSFELPPHHVPRVASQWQAPEARERIIFCILSGFGHLSIFDWRAGERTGGREQKMVPLEDGKEIGREKNHICSL